MEPHWQTEEGLEYIQDEEKGEAMQTCDGNWLDLPWQESSCKYAVVRIVYMESHPEQLSK